MIVIGHHPPFIPIAKALAAKGHQFASLSPDFAKTLANLDLPTRALAEMVTPELRQSAFKEAARLLKAAQRPINVNGLGPGAAEFVREELTGFLYPRLVDMAMLSLSLDHFKPKLVLVHNDIEPVTRNAALWARSRNVPCLHVPHAIYHDVNRGAIGSDVHDLVTASHLAAAGPVQRAWYEARGFPAANIRETGLPQFDRWATMAMDRRRARRLLNVANDRPLVVYAATWRQDTNLLGCNDQWAMVYMAFLDAMRTSEGIQVIIKTHPHGGQDSLKWHADNAKAAGVDCQLTGQHLELVLQAADVVLAPFASNVLLEGSFVPGLRLMTTHGYQDDAAVYQVEPSTDGIGQALATALNQPAPDTAELQTRYLSARDGLAWQRVTTFAEELIG